MASKKKKRKVKNSAAVAQKAERRALHRMRADENRAERLAEHTEHFEHLRAEQAFKESHEDISFQKVDISDKPVPMRVVLIRDPRSRRFG